MLSDDDIRLHPQAARKGVNWLVAVLLLVLGLAAGFAIGHPWHKTDNPPAVVADKPQPDGGSAWRPRNDEERELFIHLRRGSYSEAVAMDQAVRDHGLAVSFEYFVATGNLTLPNKPLGRTITIGLTPGTKWTGNPLTNVRLVTADPRLMSLPLALRSGTVLYDRLCQEPQAEDAFARTTCDDPLHQSGTPAEMYKGLRRLTAKEIRDMPALAYVPRAVRLDKNNVYLATGKVDLAPYHGDTAAAPVIVLDDNAQIVSGDFGKIQVVTRRNIGKGRVPYYEVYHDPVYAATMVSHDICAYLTKGIQESYPGTC